MIQESKTEDGQATVDSVAVKKAFNSPKTSKEVLLKCKLDYLSGSWTSLNELGERYGIHPKTLQARIVRESWEAQRLVILSKAQSKVEKTAAQVGSEYLQRSFSRTEKFEKAVEASLAQAGSQLPDGTPLVDPEILDVLTRSLSRLHSMALSSLRIPAVAQVDVTSKGLSVGESIVSAIEKLRNNPQQIIDITPEQVARVAQLEVEDDKST